MADFVGTPGDDTLSGTSGADTMSGLGGNDIYIVNHPGDVAVETAGGGIDIIYSAVSYRLTDNEEVENLSTIRWEALDALALWGNMLANTLIGNAGANVLDGGGGSDVLIGREGDDLYIVDSAGDLVIESSGQGTDIIYSAASYRLSDNSSVESLSTITWEATTALDLTGNGLDNTLIGNAGVNVLNGGGGNDVMLGREGNDIYIADSAGDQAIEAAGQGIDIVYSAVSYTLAANSEVENLSTITWELTDAINLTGNALDNTLIGNAGANLLNGGAGNDVLVGREGHDSYLVDSAADIVIEAAGQGIDIVYSSVSYTLAANSEIENLSTITWEATNAINLAGNQLGNTLIGNAGVNQLDGRGGADVMIGREGDDSYIADSAGDQAIEAAGQGTDIIYSAVSYALAANSEVENLSTLSWEGTDALSLTGNALNNALIGNAGANVLNGAAGSDVMLGREGDDLYLVDNEGDQVVEAAGQGIDIVYSAASFTLAPDSEVETLSTITWEATTAINLAGNGFANTLIGNAGVNVLNGGAGADTLRGMGGNDVIAFTTALGAGNIDTIVDWDQDYTILLGGEAGQPFAALASGGLQSSAFLVGAAAFDSSQVIVYNQATGALFYDADGNGAGAAVQFAAVSPGTLLTMFDFVVSGPENHKPAITSSTTASVVENSPIGTIVYQVAASDADGDRIAYALGGDDGHLFTVDGDGAVRLNAPANYESRTTYSFTVTASDSGSSSAAFKVAVAVANVNEGTGTINETGAFNDTSGSAQTISRDELIFAANPNLFNDDLQSFTIVGNVSHLADKDFFAIELHAGERLILDVDGTDGLDSFVQVLGVGENDDLETFDPGSVRTIADHNVDSFFSFRAPTAGIYFFAIQSFEGDTSGTYQLHVSIAPPATLAEIISEDVDALLSGAKWAAPGLTYAFPTSVSQYPGDIDETDPASDFAPFTAIQQQATTQLLQLAANVSSLTFQLADPATAQLRFAMSNEADPAYAYYPPRGGGLGGTAWFNKQDFNSPVKGDYAWLAILHEAGHTLGLKHGHEGPAISPERDSLEYTVMTYRSYVGAGVGGPNDGYSNEDWGYAQTLMMLDIAALQRLYGANFSYNATDTTYGWNPGTGEFSINGSGQGAPGGNRVFMTLWDGGGTDTYDLSNYGTGVTINLRPGEWTFTSAVQIANLGDGHSARGNVANALLFEGDARSLIENAVGGSGNDTIIANQALNRLTGNDGADTFRWMASSDTGVGALADTIAEFTRGSDRIDLASIDAKPGNSNSENFTFIGTAAFSNMEGELRYQAEGANLRVQGDLDGNGIADFEIVVSNHTLIAASDFFL